MTASLSGRLTGPEERRRRAAELYEAGWSVAQVAAYLHVAPATAWRDLGRVRVPSRRRRAAGPLEERRQLERRLYEEEGLSLREVAERVGVTHNAVKKDLLAVGVRLRPARRPTSKAAVTPASRQVTAPRRRHLRAVPDWPPRAVQAPMPVPLDVPPERAAIAYPADRGWHMVQAPPGWFLDMLAELD